MSHQQQAKTEEDPLRTQTRENMVRNRAASKAIQHFNKIAEDGAESDRHKVAGPHICRRHREAAKSRAERHSSSLIGATSLNGGGAVEVHAERRKSAHQRRTASADEEFARRTSFRQQVQSRPRAETGSVANGVATKTATSKTVGPREAIESSNDVLSESYVVVPDELVTAKSPQVASPPPNVPVKKSLAKNTKEEATRRGPTVEQLWPKSWGVYSDNPDRDSLDGHLPSSGHGTNTTHHPRACVDTDAASNVGADAGSGGRRATPGAAVNNKKKSSPSTPLPTSVTVAKRAGTPDALADRESALRMCSPVDPESGNNSTVWPKTEPCSQMWRSLSCMYGKLVVLVSVAFCVTEVLDTSIIPFTYQGVFLMCLYVVGIVTILCIYISVVADSLSSVSSSQQNLTASCSAGGAVSAADLTSLASFGTLKRAHISRRKVNRSSFYLRIGALLFGTGTLIFNGLEIAMHSTSNTNCSGDMAFAHPILQAIFTFLQMHFLFVNSEVVVEKLGNLARFGLVHLVATNLSVWFRMVIWDSANDWIHFAHAYANAKTSNPTELPPRAIRLQGFPGLKDLGYNGYIDLNSADSTTEVNRLGPVDAGVLYYGNPFSAGDAVSVPCENRSLFPISVSHAKRVEGLYQCYNNSTLGQMWTKSMPYLFPFIVEYSLIAAAVTYIMWTSVGDTRMKKAVTKKLRASMGTLDMKTPAQRNTDCQSASKGLFFGLLCLVSGIVVLIIFFVMKDTSTFEEHMFWLSSGTQLVVLTLSVSMTIVGFHQIPKLSLQHNRQPTPLDKMLSSVTMFGVYLIGVFGMIVGGLNITESRHMALFAINTVLIIQATLQGMLVSEAAMRHCATKQQQTFKPGRQIITFLMFSNVTLWMLDTLMAHHWLAHEMQSSYYGFLTWGVISRIGLPLMIFYRFHQAVVLVGIWKKSYKTRID